MIASKPIPHGQIETYTTADIADSIDKRYQTDNQQTYNDATSSIQTQLNAKIANTSWIDYSATSTIVGWSSFTSKFIFYKVIDDYCFIVFDINGTSNSNTLTFTAPFDNTLGYSPMVASGYSVDNGVAQTTPSRIQMSTGGVLNKIVCFKEMGSAVWNSSGVKRIVGQFSFKIN